MGSIAVMKVGSFGSLKHVSQTTIVFNLLASPTGFKTCGVAVSEGNCDAVVGARAATR